MKHVPQHDSMFTRVLSESNVNAGIAANGSKLWKDQRTQKTHACRIQGLFLLPRFEVAEAHEIRGERKRGNIDILFGT